MDMPEEEDREPTEPVGEAPESGPTETAAEAAPTEAEAPETQPTDASSTGSTTSAPQPEPEARHRTSEEALAEMRQELREEETKEQTGFRAGVGRFFNRILRRKKPAAEAETEAPSRLDELLIPETPAGMRAQGSSEVATAEAEPPAALPVEEAPPQTEGKQFEALVRQKMGGALPGLDKMEPLVPTSEPPDVAPAPEAHEYVSPFSPQIQEEQGPGPAGESILAALRRGEEEIAEEPADIRQAALEDYVAPSAEAEEESAGPLSRRLQRGWRDMRPLDRRLFVGVMVVLALTLLGGGTYLAIASAPTPTPVPTPTPSVLPIPVSLSLPGGWVFPLRIGHVVNGTWNPKDAEWLQGTEVCRWVSLPWTVQLEAVLRTLKGEDQIQLSMSNYDSLIYKVKSIQQVPATDVQQLAADTPCLLVILTKQDSDSRLVVAAKP